MKGFYIEIIYNFDFNMPLDLSKKLVYFVYAVLPTSCQLKLQYQSNHHDITFNILYISINVILNIFSTSFLYLSA